MTDPEFRADLYRGSALDYEQFRVSYPQSLIARLLDQTAPADAGRMLDLACGTGQLAFAMRGRFGQIWAVHQEPDMIAVVRAKAQAAGAADILPFVATAESASLPPQTFDLVGIGNAFHRLRRDAVAAKRTALAAPRRASRAGLGRRAVLRRRALAAGASRVDAGLAAPGTGTARE
jgi:SAM-dependent methyltransferase